MRIEAVPVVVSGQAVQAFEQADMVAALAVVPARQAAVQAEVPVVPAEQAAEKQAELAVEPEFLIDAAEYQVSQDRSNRSAANYH